MSNWLKDQLFLFRNRLLVHDLLKNQTFPNCFRIELRLLKQFDGVFVSRFCSAYILQYVLQRNLAACINYGLSMQCSIDVDDTDSWGLDLISLTEDCNGGEWCENLLESPASIGLKTCLDCILVEYCVEQIPEIIVIYAIFVCVIFFLDQCCSINFHEVEIIISAVSENQI